MLVYSTNPDLQPAAAEATPDTLPKDKQPLRIVLDKRRRKGKQVTLVTGFSGKTGDMEELAKMLKTTCGAGGSAKNGEIIVQGDFRKKIHDTLLKAGYLQAKII
jgi:translation initiation factor 1